YLRAHLNIYTFIPYTSLFRSLSYRDNKTGKQVYSNVGQEVIKKHPPMQAWNDKATIMDKELLHHTLISFLDSNVLLDFLYFFFRSEEHTSELQSRFDLVCRLL